MSTYEPPLPDDVRDVVLGTLVKDMRFVLAWFRLVLGLFAVVLVLKVAVALLQHHWVAATILAVSCAGFVISWHEAHVRVRKYRRTA